MAITAGCLVQNALKKLLKFGAVSNFVGYDALNDFFPRYTLKPNPECENRHCREWAVKRVGEAAETVHVSEAASAEVVHEDGEQWGIEVDSDDGNEAVKAVDAHNLEQAGLRRQYDATKSVVSAADVVVVGEEESVDDLAAQFNAL